jgi:hypothetical protein
MTHPLRADAFDALHDWVEVQVAAGYGPLEDIVDDAVEVFVDQCDDRSALREVARRLVGRAAAAAAIEEQSWPEVTDCDRLDAAFAELDAAGVLARQHFSCCGTCGDTEIRDELQQAIKDGVPARGFTFFHVQDTEHAVAGEGLYLSYGSIADEHDQAVAIGHEVADALRRHGFEPAWNGRLTFRILVPMVWQRRRG